MTQTQKQGQDGERETGLGKVLRFARPVPRSPDSNSISLARQLLAGGKDAIDVIRKVGDKPTALFTIATSETLGDEVKKEAVRSLARLLTKTPKVELDESCLMLILACAESENDRLTAAIRLAKPGSQAVTKEGFGRTLCRGYETTEKPALKAVFLNALEKLVRSATEAELESIGPRTPILWYVIAGTADGNLASRLLRYLYPSSASLTVMDLCADKPERGLLLIEAMERDVTTMAAIAVENPNPLLRAAALSRLVNHPQALEDVVEMGMFDDTAKAALAMLPQEKRDKLWAERGASAHEMDAEEEEGDEQIGEFLDSIAKGMLAAKPSRIKQTAERIGAVSETDKSSLAKVLAPYWDNREMLDAICCATGNVTLGEMASARMKQLDFMEEFGKSMVRP